MQIVQITRNFPSGLGICVFAYLLLNIAQSCQYQIAFSSPLRKEKSAYQGGLQFYKDDLLSRLDSAKTKGQTVFIDFYTNWCGPCRVMDRDVFTDGNLAAFFNTNYLNLKINAEQGEGIALAKRFGINSYPTLLFLDLKGDELKRLVGITTASKLIKTGKDLLSVNQ